MTYVEDLYERGDDREPEPCEWYPAPEPVDLEQVADALRIVNDKSSSEDPYPAIELLLDKALPQMLAELREARQRIAEWEALPTREEWAATPDRNTQPEPGKHGVWLGNEAGSFLAARYHQMHLWRRMLSVHPWEPIDDDAPF